MKENRTLCCSDVCERRTECGMYSENNLGTHFVEDFYNFGSARFTDDGIEEDWICSEKGNWKLFEPIKLTEKEFEKLHCCLCGSQRCEGIGTEWFNGCRYKEHLNK